MVVMEILRLTQLELLSIRIFSFMGDERLMMATLRGCDIFYMAGIYRVSAQWAQASAQGPALSSCGRDPDPRAVQLHGFHWGLRRC